jgi:hypothetical protein
VQAGRSHRDLLAQAAEARVVADRAHNAAALLPSDNTNNTSPSLRQARNAAALLPSDNTNNTSPSLTQARLDAIQMKYHGGDVICVLCNDNAPQEQIGNPPVFATGDNCNCLFHEWCLANFLSIRMPTQSPPGSPIRRTKRRRVEDDLNRCKVCRSLMYTTIRCSDEELGWVMDSRTEEEKAQDVRNVTTLSQTSNL